MSAFIEEVTCPRCGEEMVLENSAAMDCGYRMTAIFNCATRTCARWQFVGELMTCGRQPPLPAPLKESV